MNRKVLWTALLAAAAAAPAGDEKKDPKKDDKELTPADRVALIESIRPALVRAEYTLQFDKGQAPTSGSRRYYGSGVIRDERPLEVPGFLVADTKVVVPDVMIHPRFVKDVAVRFGDQLVKASAWGYGKLQTASVLELARPFKKARPLTFQPKAEGPYLTADYSRRNGVWTVKVGPLSTMVAVDDRGKQYRAIPLDCLIIDEKGAPVTVCMNGYLPVDDSWRGSPLKWPLIKAKEMAAELRKAEAAADKALLRVKLSFRSPKKGPDSALRSYRRGDEERSTEHNVIGVLIKPAEVLVLAQMKPKVTARLERIAVYGPTGDPVSAKFAHTLSDYGAFLAKLEKPLRGAMALSDGDVRTLEDQALLAAEVILQGEKRQAYFAHNRISGYAVGWKRHFYPEVRCRQSNTFLFDSDGALLVLPIGRREKVSVESRWEDRGPTLTAAAYLRQVCANLAGNVDPSNVPLTEAEENRLAWMGVELQALNKELARINKVSDLTNDGRSGALVSYVYPGSPASKAGIEPGYVLIRLHVPDHPKPLDVRVGEYAFGSRPFPWDRYDELPERFYDRIPRPWPPAESAFTRSLTDLGFGKKYTAEFSHEGKPVRKDFVVEQSPPHYDSTKRYKSEPLGLTVRNLTYEVRRYFQKTPKDAGVIVSKVEPGSKASVSGIKPYEVVTHVNDKPVANVADFEKLTAGQAELRLSIKRMTRGRIVKIKMDKPAPAASEE